jgi:DNA repair protein RadC
MPNHNPTRPYGIPGFRIALVREPGMKLAERPQIRLAADAAPLLAQYIGDTDREVFVVAMLTVRHRVLGFHTLSSAGSRARSFTRGKCSSPLSLPEARPLSSLTTTRAGIPSHRPKTSA